MMKTFKSRKNPGKSIAVLSIKQGLTLVIPFLILGSFALLFQSFPYPPYQEFMSDFLGGRILSILTSVYNITLGSLALLLTVTISLSFGKMAETNEAFYYAVTAVVPIWPFAVESRKTKNIFLDRSGCLRLCASHWHPASFSA